MKFNKFVIYVLIMAMVLSLAACGGDRDTSDERTSGKHEIQDEELLEDDEEESRDDRDDNKEESGADNRDIELEEFKTDQTIEETVLYDENDLRITATDLTYTTRAAELSILIENNSDTDYSFTSGTWGYCCNAVNGYMVSDGYLNEDVLAGKKANAKISFNLDGLAVYGITEIADIQISFSIHDDDYNYIHTEPLQVKTAIADSYDYDTDTYQNIINSGILEVLYNCSIDYYAEDDLYNNSGIEIVSEVLTTNRNGEQALLLEIQNNSSEIVYGIISRISLNGLIIESYNWSGDNIIPGTRCIIDLRFSSMLDSEYWDIFGINEIGEIAFSLALEDVEDNELAAPQEVSIVISERADSLDISGTEIYNDNDIRFIYKDMVVDSDYDDEIHILLLVENNCGKTIWIDDDYDSLSINGFMIDYSCYSREVPDGRYTAIDIEIDVEDLEEIGVEEIEDIEEAEIVFKIKDEHYNTIDEPKLSIIF